MSYKGNKAIGGRTNAYTNKSYETTEEEEGNKIPRGPKGSSSDAPEELPKTASKAFEILLNSVGDCHRYQWKIFFVTGIINLFSGSHNMSAVFLAASPDHRCKIPYLKNKTQNFEEKSIINLTIPWVEGNTGNLQPSQCSYYEYKNSTFLINLSHNVSNEKLKDFIQEFNGEDKVVVPCQSWIYDKGIFQSTVVTEWDLVCDDRWMMSSIQSTFMIGILVGAIIFTFISDKLGRRLSILICDVLFVITSVAATFTTSYPLFLFIRFLVAASGQGLTLVTFVLLMESLNLKGRTVLGSLVHVLFVLGFVFLIVSSYYIRDWRMLHLTISVPSIILLFHYWTIDESARWLLTNGKEEEGIQMLKSMAKCNKFDFPSDEKLKPLLKVIQDEVKQKQKTNFVQKLKSLLDMTVTLVRTPNMRRRNLVMCYGWFVTSTLFYGLAFSGESLNISSHALCAISSTINGTAAVVCIPIIQRFGRKPTLILSYILGGIACVCLAFIPLDQAIGKLALVVFGRLAMAVTFCVIFLFSSELVPTHVRSISIGMASVWGRIGSALAPFIVDLLGNMYYAIPSTIFGVISIIAGLLSFLLPETGNKNLPESIEEIEAMRR